MAQLLGPLEQALLGSPPAATVAPAGSDEGCTAEGGRQEALQQALMALYEFPDRSPGL